MVESVSALIPAPTFHEAERKASAGLGRCADASPAPPSRCLECVFVEKSTTLARVANSYSYMHFIGTPRRKKKEQKGKLMPLEKPGTMCVEYG